MTIGLRYMPYLEEYLLILEGCHLLAVPQENLQESASEGYGM